MTTPQLHREEEHKLALAGPPFPPPPSSRHGHCREYTNAPAYGMALATVTVT